MVILSTESAYVWSGKVWLTAYSWLQGGAQNFTTYVIYGWLLAASNKVVFTD